MNFSEKDCTNYDLCSKCKGRCCKEFGGCWFLPSDFKTLDLEYLDNLIKKKEYISIAAVIQIYGIPIIPPMLHLKIRNVGDDICCISSNKGRCVCLESDGCRFKKFEDRPSGGKALIPCEKGCYSLYTPDKVALEWKPYQDLLRQLWSLNTEYTVEETIAIEIKKQSLK